MLNEKETDPSHRENIFILFLSNIPHAGYLKSVTFAYKDLRPKFCLENFAVFTLNIKILIIFYNNKLDLFWRKEILFIKSSNFIIIIDIFS